MVEVTSAATTQIAEYFKNKEISPVRIFLSDGG
jgi:Fe-S cluster assembly iron-binding protein IscA